MFRTVSITGFTVVLAGIAVHYLFARPKMNELFGSERRWRILDPLRVLVFLFTLLLLPQKLNIIGILRKLLYLLALLCFVVLAVTGFFPKLVLHKTISGYWLMVHATFAPVFAACLAVLAVMWAHNCRLDKRYWPWLQNILGRKSTDKADIQKHELSLKISFWLIMVLALPLILSIVASMFPFFGTDVQELPLDTHRYTAILFAAVAVVYTYLIILSQAKK